MNGQLMHCAWQGLVLTASAVMTTLASQCLTVFPRNGASLPVCRGQGTGRQAATASQDSLRDATTYRNNS